METIKRPMSKLEKVAHLLKIAEELKIWTVDMFDQLMDKYEKHYHAFDFMIENIDGCIIEKVDIEVTKKNFLKLLRINTSHELRDAVLGGSIYINYDNNDLG